MVYRCILPDWAVAKYPGLKKVVEGDFNDEYLQALNKQGYNCYFLPNYPTAYDKNATVDGSHIDSFNFVFIDMDSKAGYWKTKDQFIEYLQTCGPTPTYVVDSGHGVHAYWQVTDLDAMSYLKIQRRLCRYYNTDDAVCKIYQLMRVPATINTKNEVTPVECKQLYETDTTYTCEELDKILPPITHEDSAYCQAHFDKTYHVGEEITVNERMPLKFYQLLRNSPEVKEIWSGNSDDRSKADYRLGHIMFANDFTKDEAMSVLVNSAKALPRAPAHRIGYAQGIVDKIWTFEEAPDTEGLTLSNSVKEILQRSGDTLKGTRFPCHKYIDATLRGFRLGQVVGLVAGSGVGKTAMALNMFQGFVKNNPEYDHFFVPLEQPAAEIAERWKTMCGSDTKLHEKVHVISNYNDDGSFRHLSFDDLKQYILKFQKLTGRKIGCVVIDHIGALKKTGKNGENQDLMDICHEMKAFAVQTNTLMIMQSQAPREKAGIGDLELNKDAAYGTVFFESYCDFLITIWQPVKRCHSESKCPTVTSFKFCKIRHKNTKLDEIQEDVPYKLFFDPMNETFRELTQMEEKSFDFFNKKSTATRRMDRKTDLVPYKSITWTKGGKDDTSSALETKH
jgi:KaiC/GvpD/RAD55 family RecA-like ATPase